MQALAAEAINKLPLAESQRDRQHRTFSVNSQNVNYRKTQFIQ